MIPQNFIRTQQALSRSYGRASTIVGVETVSFAKDRFKRQGWFDKSFEPWEKRKTKDRNSKRRNIGTKTGRLRRSIRVLSKTRTMVFTGTDVPYAQAFNEGFEGIVEQTVRRHKVRQHTRTIRGQKQVVQEHTKKEHSRKAKRNQPARTFLGESRLLNRRIEMNLEHDIRRELKFLKSI